MKKLAVIIFIFLLIFSTAIIKNSQKNWRWNLWKEKLKDFEKELGDTRLEYDYLSSTENYSNIKTVFLKKILFKKT